MSGANTHPKVTRRLLASMRKGDVLMFRLADGMALESGRNTAYSYGRAVGRRYSCTTFRTDRLVLKITALD